MQGIDWQKLALKYEVSSERGGLVTTHSGGTVARRCLEEIIGEVECVRAVDCYVANEPGSELARSVLRLLRPESAVARCAELARDKAIPVEQRRMAVELLRSIASLTGLRFVEEFLSDDDPGVQAWAATIVSQLVLDGDVTEEECSLFVDGMANHSNPAVRDVAESTREWFSRARLRER